MRFTLLFLFAVPTLAWAQGSCRGYTATATYGAGCQGQRQTYAAPTGCRGAAVQMGFPESPAYEVEVRVKLKAPPTARASTGCYGGGAALAYGAPRGDGGYATSTGLPPGPGVLGLPGASFPFDGPVRRGTRWAAGYDPGPDPRRRR